MSSERKAVIKSADMAEDMQQDAVDCASQALEKYNIEKVRWINGYLAAVICSRIACSENSQAMRNVSTVQRPVGVLLFRQQVLFHTCLSSFWVHTGGLMQFSLNGSHSTSGVLLLYASCTHQALLWNCAAIEHCFRFVPRCQLSNSGVAAAPNCCLCVFVCPLTNTNHSGHCSVYQEGVRQEVQPHMALHRRTVSTTHTHGLVSKCVFGTQILLILFSNLRADEQPVHIMIPSRFEFCFQQTVHCCGSFVSSYQQQI
jgi:hypothetical protein